MISEVHCPHCGKPFYITVDDFKDHPEEKYCHCVFCQREFGVLEGKPWPPLEGGASAESHAGAK